jgi:hypothetical protein
MSPAAAMIGSEEANATSEAPIRGLAARENAIPPNRSTTEIKYLSLFIKPPLKNHS